MKPRINLIALLMLVLSLRITTAQSLEYHQFKFFIHPDLVQGLTDAEVKARLSQYVDDLNLIFAKQTIRRFVFDPNQDIILTTTNPYTGNCYGTLPDSGYEIWAHVQLSAYPDYGSYGGYCSYDVSGAGVAAGLYWDAIHDRTTLVDAEPGSWELSQYWHQLHNLTHEIEHTFGAGMGEYYSLRQINDMTGIGPTVNVNINAGAATDSYWSSHEDFWTDPLTLWVPVATWYDLTNQVRFADLTVALANGPYRSDLFGERSLPDLQQTTIWIRDVDSGQPLANASVMAWNILTFSPFTPGLLFSGTTDGAGSVEFPWSGGLDNVSSMMLIKVFQTNGAPPAVKWFSIYDAQEQRMLEGRGKVDITLSASTPETLASNRPPTLTLVSPIPGGVENSPLTINYSTLLAASDAWDADGNAIIFRLESILSGTLTKSGRPVVMGTTLRSGDSWAWTPPANANGSALNAFSVTAFDGGASSGGPVPVRVNVTAVNSPPTLDPINNSALSEDFGPLTIPLTGISSGAPDETDTLSVTAISSDPALIPNPVVHYTSPQSSGTLVLTPVTNANGTATITVTVNDGHNTTSRSFQEFVCPVNDPPTLNAITTLTINEDAGAPINLGGITSGAANETQILTVTATSSDLSVVAPPAVGYSSPQTTGTLTVRSATNASGSAIVTVTVGDGEASTSRSFTVNVNPVNDAPSFSLSGTNVAVAKNSGAKTVAGWAKNISAGPANESGQTVTFTVTNNNNALFTKQPAISSSGTLTFQPAQKHTGTATVTVYARDNGGVANGGIDKSANRTFTISVN